jgi:chromosome segregation ATPase
MYVSCACVQASAAVSRLTAAVAEADQQHAASEGRLQEQIQQLQAAAAHSLSSHSTQLQDFQQQLAAAQAAEQAESSRAAEAEAELAACRKLLGSEQGQVQQLRDDLQHAKQQLADRADAMDR